MFTTHSPHRMRDLLLCFTAWAIYFGVGVEALALPLQLGKHKRALRAIANLLKQEKELPVLQCKEPETPSAGFISELNHLLAAHELCQVKLKVKKRKEANSVGEILAEKSDSLLAQCVGHSVLLYKASLPAGRVTKLLNESNKKTEMGEAMMELGSDQRTIPVNNSPPSVILTDVNPCNL